MDRTPDAPPVASPAEGRYGRLRDEARFHTLVTAFADYVWMCTPEGRLKTDMPSWREVTGQTAEELLGYGWLEGVHPDDRERTAETWSQAVATDGLYVVEYRITGVHGERNLSVRGAPVRNDRGEVVEWIGTCTDITDQRLAETQRARLELDLREEQETLRQVVEQSKTGVLLLTGRDLVVSMFNDPMVEMVPTGRLKVGRGLADCLPELDHLWPTYERVLAGETIEFKELPVAFDGPLALDGFRYYDVTYTPVTGADRQAGLLVVASEVTEEVRRRSDLEQRLVAERRLGVELQHALLPASVPAFDTLDLAVRYAPAAERIGVGGDWYDVLSAGGRTTLVIGDVCGNGLAAATAMAQLRAAVRAYVLEGLHPAAVLERASSYCARLELADMATAAVVQLRPETGDLWWACAGHPPPLVVPADGPAELLWTTAAPPLGPEGGGYVEHSRVLEPDASIVLYTDGLVEDRHRSLDETLEELRRAVSGTWRSAGELRDEISRRLPTHEEDDVALLVCRRPAGPRVHRRFPPQPRNVGPMRDLAAGVARDNGFPREVVSRIRLATSEAATNAVVHAARNRPGPVDVIVTLVDDELTVVVADQGAGVIPRPDSPGAGVGVEIIHAVADHAEWLAPETGGTVVRMRFSRPA